MATLYNGPSGARVHAAKENQISAKSAQQGRAAPKRRALGQLQSGSLNVQSSLKGSKVSCTSQPQLKKRSSKHYDRPEYMFDREWEPPSPPLEGDAEMKALLSKLAQPVPEKSLTLEDVWSFDVGELPTIEDTEDLLKGEDDYGVPSLDEFDLDLDDEF